MTIDERLQFLLQSTESLHESVFENTKQIAELTKLAAKNEKRWARIGRALEAALEAWDDEENGDA